MWAVTSLWPQKVVCGSQIYSARAKLMHISDQAGEIVLKAGLYVSLSKQLVYIQEILNKSTESGKFTCDDLSGP